MVKQFYAVLILVGSVLFVIGVFNGVFVDVGETLEPVVRESEITCEGLDYMDTFVSTEMPVVKYRAGVQQAGTYIPFGEQFEGISGEEFTIDLLDIKNQRGESVLLLMTEDELANIQEIPASFVYVEEQDILCCFTSGSYTVQIKVRGENGGTERYEFQLPVESQ